MPDVRVEVDAETADALQAECELLGFDGPEAYLAWIVENRAAIEQGTESAELLAAYRERLAALEARLAAEGIHPDAVDLASESSDSASAERSDSALERSESETSSSAETTEPSDDSTATADTPSEATETAVSSSVTTATVDASTAEMPAAQTHTIEASVDSRPDERDGAAREADDSATIGNVASSDASDSERDASSTDDAETAGTASDASPTAGTTASDGGTRTDADITSMHLSPERVQRVNEDPVARDAGELSNVTAKRVDELSRRAVAETREQLDRDVETGLSYESSAAMSSDVRPGEDLADLDAIEVPGRSEELVAERREVVGRALAQLRDRGSARRSEFVDALYEDHPAGYETADGWWRCVREGLSQVDAVDGGHVWEYVE